MPNGHFFMKLMKRSPFVDIFPHSGLFRSGSRPLRSTAARRPAILLRKLVAVEGVKIKIGHELGLNVVHGFAQSFYEFVEIFLVQEDLMPVIPIVIKAFTALCNGQEIIISPGRAYIKKIGAALTSPDAFAVDTVGFTFVVLVRHGFDRLVKNGCQI